jgi:hypothetical protein
MPAGCHRTLVCSRRRREQPAADCSQLPLDCCAADVDITGAEVRVVAPDLRDRQGLRRDVRVTTGALLGAAAFFQLRV